MNWVDESIGNYYEWLKKNTFVTKSASSDWHCISTPFYGTFNDSIEIFVKADNENIFLSDDGVTLNNLELVGSAINRSSKRKEWLDMILLNYGVNLTNNELMTSGKMKEFPQKTHNLLCAILEITEMAISAKHTISSLFREDVKVYLEEQNIICTPQFIAKGTTGLEFSFDYQIAGKRKEIVIKSFNSLNKINVPHFLFAWDDVKPAREKISGKELTGLAIINNEERETKKEYLEALESKGAKYILWDQRYRPDAIESLNAA